MPLSLLPGFHCSSYGPTTCPYVLSIPHTQYRVANSIRLNWTSGIATYGDHMQLRPLVRLPFISILV